MRFLQSVLICILLSSAAQSWGQEASSSASVAIPPADDQWSQQLIDDGARILSAGDPARAISDYFDKVITAYLEKYGDAKEKIYSARTSAEALMYMLEATNNKTPAKAIKSSWAYAYFLKSYALVELHRPQESRMYLDKALEMAPHNAQFLEELGSRYQNEKNWDKAIETFQLAETAAKIYSPPQSKNFELGHAWRGLGYVFVEQNRLDDAENIYKKCLELDAGDKKAANELQYIQRMRAKQEK